MSLMKMLHKTLLQAICFNLAFLLVCLGIGGVHAGSLDDYFMSAIITGAYGGGFDSHILFVNGAYAYFLKSFYWLFPSVGWYYIFQAEGGTGMGHRISVARSRFLRGPYEACPYDAKPTMTSPAAMLRLSMTSLRLMRHVTVESTITVRTKSPTSAVSPPVR